ncbi:MAG: hypothetical protein KIT85_02500 [Pseudolabrys sp.]|nr:hypothetical protein [Pseudolabrys sp.]
MVAIGSRGLGTRLAVAGALALSLVTAARSQPWTEAPYNPPVGSRWIVTAQSASDEQRPDGARQNKTLSRYELTIEEKTATGYRISYVNRALEVDGNAPGLKIVAPAFEAMRGIVVRASTDAGGKPVSIDNLDEVRGTMRKVIDGIADGFKEKPQVAQVMRQMMESMFLADGVAATTAYLENVPQLAMGQNTGLKPGDSRETVEQTKAPVGNGTIKTTLTTRMVSWNDGDRKVRYAQVRAMDPQGLRDFLQSFIDQLGNAASPEFRSPQMQELLKKTDFSIDSTTLIDVENGMTRAIDETSTTRVSLMGQTMSKRENRRITVSPAQ